MVPRMGTRRTAALLLAATLLAPAAAGAGDRGESDRAYEHYRRNVARTLAGDQQTARRLLAQVDQTSDEQVVDWYRDVHDLDGDGASEVLLERWRITLDPVVFAFTGTYEARVLDGASGRVEWTYGNDFERGWPVLAQPVSLGEGRPGFVFFTIDEATAEAPTRRVTLDAAYGSGEIVWTRAFTSTYNYATGSAAASDVPTTVSRFEPDGDEATEYLVALTDFAGAATVRSDVYALDAADGSLSPLGEVGPDPFLDHSIGTGPDIDGRRGDDFVVVGAENTDDAYMAARSGLDGSPIWETPAKLGRGTWTSPVRDMSGDGAWDLAVGWDRPNDDEPIFQFWDARRGVPLWKAHGVFPYVLGDHDRDGRPDVGSYEFIHDENRSGARFQAFSRGRLLYRTTQVQKPLRCTGFCSSFGFYLDGGDIDADGLRDTYVLVTMSDGQRSEVHEYAVAGADGGLLYRQRRLSPVLGSLDAGPGTDLVGFARAGKDEVRVEALDGDSRRTLWSRSYRMRGADGLGPFGAYDAAAELDGDRGSELVLEVTAGAARTLVAVDGRSGEILWQRPLTGGRWVEANR
jgi:hypothetical protein